MVASCKNSGPMNVTKILLKRVTNKKNLVPKNEFAQIRICHDKIAVFRALCHFFFIQMGHDYWETCFGVPTEGPRGSSKESIRKVQIWSSSDPPHHRSLAHLGPLPKRLIELILKRLKYHILISHKQKKKKQEIRVKISL